VPSALLLLGVVFNLVGAVQSVYATVYGYCKLLWVGDKESIRMGFYSFNPLLLGILVGTFYLVSPAAFARLL